MIPSTVKFNQKQVENILQSENPLIKPEALKKKYIVQRNISVAAFTIGAVAIVAIAAGATALISTFGLAAAVICVQIALAIIPLSYTFVFKRSVQNIIDKNYYISIEEDVSNTIKIESQKEENQEKEAYEVALDSRTSALEKKLNFLEDKIEKFKSKKRSYFHLKALQVRHKTEISFCRFLKENYHEKQTSRLNELAKFPAIRCNNLTKEQILMNDLPMVSFLQSNMHHITSDITHRVIDRVYYNQTDDKAAFDEINWSETGFPPVSNPKDAVQPRIEYHELFSDPATAQEKIEAKIAQLNDEYIEVCNDIQCLNAIGTKHQKAESFMNGAVNRVTLSFCEYAKDNVEKIIERHEAFQSGLMIPLVIPTPIEFCGRVEFNSIENIIKTLSDHTAVPIIATIVQDNVNQEDKFCPVIKHLRGSQFSDYGLPLEDIDWEIRLQQTQVPLTDVVAVELTNSETQTQEEAS